MLYIYIYMLYIYIYIFSQLITVNLQYNGIEIMKQYSDVNYVKSIHIRGWSGPHYAKF